MWVRTWLVNDVTCFQSACPCLCRLHRVFSGQGGGWIAVLGLSPSRGLCSNEPPLCASYIQVFGVKVSCTLPATSTIGPWIIFFVIWAPENWVIFVFLISGCWGLGPTGVVPTRHASVYVLIRRLADQHGRSCLLSPLEGLLFLVFFLLVWA